METIGNFVINNLWLWATILAFSLVGTVVIYFYNKNNKKKNFIATSIGCIGCFAEIFTIVNFIAMVLTIISFLGNFFSGKD